MSEVALPQGTIEYTESGEGPPIVFAHGLLVDGRLWRKVTPLLDDRHRCIVPNLPLGSHRIPMNPEAFTDAIHLRWSAATTFSDTFAQALAGYLAPQSSRRAGL